MVHGDREAVDALLTHPGVDSVSFVGSTPIARHIYETATAHGKRVQALGGAKNHAVVLPDADLDVAADALVSAGYGSAGQRCMAVSVAVAVGDVADPLVAKVRERMAALTVGDGADDGSDMGPLVSARHLEKVRGLVDAGVQEGATLLEDGRGLSLGDGHFIGPCLFDHVRPGMSIYDQEIFGPVLLVVRCDTYPEALELVNANPHGNGAAVFTNDGGAARLFEQQVTAGMVGINVPIPVPMAYHSFGGWKASLFGDLHVHGRHGVRFYTRDKVVTRRWVDPAGRRGVDLGFPTSRLTRARSLAWHHRIGGWLSGLKCVWPETSRGVRRWPAAPASRWPPRSPRPGPRLPAVTPPTTSPWTCRCPGRARPGPAGPRPSRSRPAARST